MNRKHLKSLIVVGFLIVVTGVAMGSLNQKNSFTNPVPPQGQDTIFSRGNGPLVLSSRLIQDKIFSGGDGTVALSLTLHADDMLASAQDKEQHIDMVIVLDQSGSMRGQKIEYARQAILNLLSSLSAEDRLAIIGYADSVWQYSDLINVTATNREKLQSIISTISSGGHTNLGAGLQRGINTLLATHKNGNLGKVILISDGLANRGITHPDALANIASIAVEEEFAIGTVGVGNDFNEQLLTAIADRGTGNYYYLADPQSFVEVFYEEFQHAKTVAAHAIKIRIPLPDGVSLVEASGYPITITNNYAIIHPGDLLSGQTRKLFLTLKIPTHSEGTYELSGINVQYLHKESSYTVMLSEPFRIVCVNNPDEAVASIVQSEWEEKVLQEDFNDLREKIAIDLKDGDQEGAMEKIDQYHKQQQHLNAEVGSTRVTTNLNEDLDKLRSFVRQTFKGDPQQIEEQQKANAKALQYQGYKERRAQK